MNIEIVKGDITSTGVDGILVSLCEDSERLGLPAAAIVAVDSLLQGAIGDLLDTKGLKGKPGEVVVLNTLKKLPARAVAVCGLGKQADVTRDRVRDAVADGCRALRKFGCHTVATTLMGAGAVGLDEGSCARAVAEGALLGLYTFSKYKRSEDSDITSVKLVVSEGVDRVSVDSGVETGTALAEATNLARDMVNEPANVMNPTRMGEIAREIGGQYGIDVHVMDVNEMKDVGMGALLGVAQGSAQPPAFIRMDYRGADSSSPVAALIGKAITFDSGGISIKPSEGLAEMKDDMAGGAAVIAAMMAIARLKLPVNVSGLVPSTENLPGGKAFRPGDVLKSLGGTTIEIISTDAEGRLALADALDYARKEGMSPIVDVATLTGACRVALGNGYSGLFGNRDELVKRFEDAARESGERVWQLPLPEDYKEFNKSLIADIKNTGNRYGGAITAALFLSEFAGDVPWLHLDIAGTSNSSKDSGATLKGATGVATRTLFEFMRMPSA